MEIPIPAQGFSENQLAVRTAGFWGGPKILYNGEVAAKGEERGTFVATNTNGTQSVLRIRPSLFGFDPIPKVEIDGQEYTLAPPLQWFVIIWAIAPILMIPIGGALGSLFGLIAAAVNLRIFRTEMSTIVKYLVSAFVSISAIVAFLIAAILLSTVLQ
ncbi:MAG: hypothetical protein DWQ07_04980 [Chloroflexi bacterium]|nr:MAG: hypothetical protein DWQ07_04980 [Chloroflexota bacterium]MBL1194786.1 hypothetical protein [Chloroflexota bacterium]NOH12078.1 hypothetical protein [Chloroflexota bacterium]